MRRIDRATVTAFNRPGRHREMARETEEQAGTAWDADLKTRESDPERLRIAVDVFEAIREHMREGGTYRHLIYGRLGFGMDAYGTLQAAGALDVSNFIYDAREAGVE